MEMLGGLEGVGGCSTLGLWLTIIRRTPATFTACTQPSQSQWEKPKHQWPTSTNSKTDRVLKDTLTNNPMNYMCMQMWVAPTQRLSIQVFFFSVCARARVCVSLLEWEYYQGHNNAVGSLRDDCVQVSRYRGSWRNVLFLTPCHPRDPERKGCFRGCLSNVL